MMGSTDLLRGNACVLCADGEPRNRLRGGLTFSTVRGQSASHASVTSDEYAKSFLQLLGLTPSADTRAGVESALPVHDIRHSCVHGQTRPERLRGPLVSSMLLNYETAIVGERCILVPYRNEHVPKYHKWMQDAQLLESTGSEPLSLESEYEMQDSWRCDERKCTFIVLDREKVDEHCFKALFAAAEDSSNGISANLITETLLSMCGDVNLFFSDLMEDEEETDNVNADALASSPPHLQAEVDIMVAEPASRGKGIGREAVLLMMGFAQKHLPVVRFFCKINADNDASRSLFERKLGFRECAYVECFQQYEYELKQTNNNEREDEWDTKCGAREYEGSMILHCPIVSAEMKGEKQCAP